MMQNARFKRDVFIEGTLFCRHVNHTNTPAENEPMPLETEISVDTKDSLNPPTTKAVYDAIDSIDTYDFYWYQLKKARDGSYTGNAVHKYYDEYGKVRKVYTSYRVKKSGGEYKIVEVGSSDRKL